MNTEKSMSDKSIKSDLFELLFKLVALVVIIGASFTFIFGIFVAPDDSMSLAVKPGDVGIYYRFERNYDIDTVVVVSVNGKKQVRRVVAGPGDTVDIQKKGLYINGNLHAIADKEILPYKNGFFVKKD